MLTHVQARALGFIAACQAQRGGVSPSYAEIADHLALRSRNSAARIIDRLEERGFIRRRPHCARAIEVLRRPNERPRLHLKYATDDEVRAEVLRRWPDLASILGVASTGAAASRERGNCQAGAGTDDLEFGATHADVCQDPPHCAADVFHGKPPLKQGNPATGGFRGSEKLLAKREIHDGGHG